MSNQLNKLTLQQLERAIAIRQEIDRLEAELQNLGNNGVARRGRPPRLAQAIAAAPRGKKKRTMSPEARAKIAAAQRARWAKTKSGK